MEDLEIPAEKIEDIEMCVNICDCNNCYKKKTCADCEYINTFHNIDCSKDGIQRCPFKIPFRKLKYTDGNELEYADNPTLNYGA